MTITKKENAKIEFIDHTADAMFRVTANTLEEAFSGAALALTKIMTEDRIKPLKKEFIHVKAKTLDSLLYDFLQELVFLFDTKSFLLSHVHSIVIKSLHDSYLLKAEIIGDEAEKYEIKDYIKAITYNNLFVKQNHDVIIQVVVDL